MCNYCSGRRLRPGTPGKAPGESDHWDAIVYRRGTVFQAKEKHGLRAQRISEGEKSGVAGEGTRPGQEMRKGGVRLEKTLYVPWGGWHVEGVSSGA